MSSNYFIPRGFRDPVSGNVKHTLDSGSPYLTGGESARLLQNTADWLDNTDYRAYSLGLHKTTRAISMASILLGRVPIVVLGMHTTDEALIKDSEVEGPDLPFAARISGGVVGYYFKKYGMREPMEPWSEKGSTPLRTLSSVLETFPLPIHTVEGYGLSSSVIVSLGVKGILDLTTAKDITEMGSMWQHPHLNLTGNDLSGMRFTANYTLGGESIEYKIGLQLEPPKQRGAI